MNVVVIHDDRRKEEERTRCEKELERQGISQFNFWPANYEGATVEAAINTSHKQVVAKAKVLDWEEVCIMESDVMFPAEDGWEYFLKNKPVFPYDLYVAARYSSSMNFFRMLRPHIPFSFIPIATPAGFHCYIIHSRYYDRFLSSPADAHIDTIQAGGDYFVCYPFAAIQRPGWSANNKKDVNYNVDLTAPDVYGWV